MMRPHYQGVILLDFTLQDHSRNQPKKGRISPTLHFDAFLDHRFQYLLMNSREASKKTFICCILYRTKLQTINID